MLGNEWVWSRSWTCKGHVEEAVAQVSRANTQQNWKLVKKGVTSLNKTTRNTIKGLKVYTCTYATIDSIMCFELIYKTAIQGHCIKDWILYQNTNYYILKDLYLQVEIISLRASSACGMASVLAYLPPLPGNSSVDDNCVQFSLICPLPEQLWIQDSLGKVNHNSWAISWIRMEIEPTQTRHQPLPKWAHWRMSQNYDSLWA